MNSIQHEPLKNQLTYLAHIQLLLISISTKVGKHADIMNELHRLGIYLPPSDKVPVFDNFDIKPKKKSPIFYRD